MADKNTILSESAHVCDGQLIFSLDPEVRDEVM